MEKLLDIGFTAIRWIFFLTFLAASILIMPDIIDSLVESFVVQYRN